MNERLQRTRQIVSLLDLTTLSGTETPQEIDALCLRAATVCGPVAALCVPLRHVSRARAGLTRLGLTGVEVATVANFPAGGLALAASVSEIRDAVQQGATEVDLVLPYRAFLQGRESQVRAFLDSCRQECTVRLKVIIESGALGGVEQIRAASRLVLDCGADFLKTSTGKASVHATPEAARTMLSVIAEGGGRAGFKASGGLRTMADAQVYLDLATEIMGAAWIGPQTFRFGASSLLDDVLAVAAREGGCVGSA
jgi:deoxyribose-phosphate aldolase